MEEREWESREYNIEDKMRRGRDWVENGNSKDGGVGNCFFKFKGIWSFGKRWGWGYGGEKGVRDGKRMMLEGGRSVRAN